MEGCTPSCCAVVGACPIPWVRVYVHLSPAQIMTTLHSLTVGVIPENGGPWASSKVRAHMCSGPRQGRGNGGERGRKHTVQHAVQDGFNVPHAQVRNPPQSTAVRESGAISGSLQSCARA